MSKMINGMAVTAALFAVSASGLVAADAPPAEVTLIAKALPWVGAPSTPLPKSLLLQKNSQIVAIGDSITYFGGYLRDSDAALAKLYPALALPKIINAGIGGHMAENLVARFQKDVVDHQPAVVTISIGINDVNLRLKAPPDEKILKAYQENISKMVDLAQRKGIKVILLTPTLIWEDPKGEGNKRLVQYVDAMKAVALDKKCGLADVHAMFLEALKHKPANVGAWLTRDGIHLSPVGDAVMAIGVLRALGVPDQDLARLR